MANEELAKILGEIAEYLAMDDIPFKPQAYRKAALLLEGLGRDAKELYDEGGEKELAKIKGIGKNISEKIGEYLKTGKIKAYEDLKKKIPVDLEGLCRVEGIGPKTVKVLYSELVIKDIKGLEKAAKSGKIAGLSRFGKKAQQNILDGIAFVKKSSGRFLLGEMLPKVREIERQIGSLKGIRRIEAAGSVRRRKETVGDIDFLVVSDEPERAMEYFVSMPGVRKVWGKGAAKSSVRTKEGYDIDVRVVTEKVYGAALQYFTGNKDHNIALRKIAIDKGFRLNEYGLFKGRRLLASGTEEDIYEALGMDCPPPEIRRNDGEIEAAMDRSLPELLELKDIKGDLHCHSDWDGGKNSIWEMAKAAMELGYGYLGISDHTRYLRIENGLDEKRLSAQRKEIDRLNGKFARQGKKFRILQGAETNILKDGSIDIDDAALCGLDYAIGGIHSHFKMQKAEMTERIIKAMKNPHIRMISHPTGRILGKRDEYEADFGKLLAVAREYDVVLEINSQPRRLDLDEQNIRRAKEAGVRLCVNTDAHHKDQMLLMEHGVFQARRGWAEKKDVINSWPPKRLLGLFRK